MLTSMYGNPNLAGEMRNGKRREDRFGRRVTATVVENAAYDRIEAGTVSVDARMVPLFNPLRKTEFLSVKLRDLWWNSIGHQMEC